MPARILAVLVLVVMLTSAALACGQAEQDSSSAMQPSASGIGAPLSDASAREFELWNERDVKQPDIKFKFIPMRRAETCYMIRSYLFVRENRSSDSTRRVGVTTCTPSSKFGVKSAVQSLPANAR